MGKHKIQKKSWTKYCKYCGVVFVATGRFCMVCKDCKIIPGTKNSLQGRPPGSVKSSNWPSYEVQKKMIVKTSYKEICMKRQSLVIEARNLKITIDRYREKLKGVYDEMQNNDDYLVDEIKFD